MYTINQIEAGIAKYLDSELMPQLDMGSWQKVLVGTAITIGIKRYRNILEPYTKNPVLKQMGIVDDNGDVDIDLLRDALKENIGESGFKLPEMPIIGVMTLKKSDVDSLYNYITTNGAA